MDVSKASRPPTTPLLREGRLGRSLTDGEPADSALLSSDLGQTIPGLTFPTGRVMFSGLQPSASPPPQHFTIEEVEKYYLTPEGGLTEVGQALFARAKARYMDNIPTTPIGSPTVYMTGGIPGSGKGKIVERLWNENPDFVLVDADRLKEDVLADLATANPALVPQMELSRKWATVVHRASRVMAHELMLEALDSGKDILFDSTLASPNVQEYRSFVQHARERGCRVQAILCSVDVKKATERAAHRSVLPTIIETPGSKLILTGRYVPLELLPGAHKGLISNRDAFLQEGLFDNLTIYDSSRDGEPLVLESQFERVQLADGSYTSQPVPR